MLRAEEGFNNKTLRVLFRTRRESLYINIMTNLHITRAPQNICKRYNKCNICRRKTRHLQTLMSWWGIKWECGKCGNIWDDGCLRRSTKKQKANRINEFHNRWKNATTFNEAMQNEMAYLGFLD